MAYKGSSAYDQSEFFSNYMKRRNRPDSPNNAIEGPVIEELIGDVRGKKILDLGCGDASFGKELLSRGAGFYTGVEGSEQMAAAAEANLFGEHATIHLASMESFDYVKEDHNLVTSRFAIHYVSDIDQLFLNVHQVLQDHGQFVFSVQHPVTTSSFASKRETGDKRGSWMVDDYFLEGERKEPWINQEIVKYHRSIEHYFAALTSAGFSVVDLQEGTPKREHFSSEEEFLRRRRIPLVLIFSCIKKMD